MKLLILARLAYLYLGYFIVGLDEESFQISKAGYLFRLANYSGAAKAYQRALEGTKAPYVYGWLGHCYLNLAQFDRAIECLQTALAKKPEPVFAIGLAWSYLGNGETVRCAELLAKLRNENTLDERGRAELEEIEGELRKG